ncbi:MAG TPA: VOC family protein [Thermomicrobiales bacterium]|nr:VOC family protein [Thermomicrobiales bacterium]
MGMPAVVHWDINARDAARLQRFYRDLFDWELRASDHPNQFAYLEPDGAGIGGGIGQEPRAGEEGHGLRHRGVTFFVQVDDVPTYLARVVRLGGKALWGPEEVPVNLTLAMFEDLEGNRIGLMRR